MVRLKPHCSSCRSAVNLEHAIIGGVRTLGRDVIGGIDQHTQIRFVENFEHRVREATLNLDVFEVGEIPIFQEPVIGWPNSLPLVHQVNAERSITGHLKWYRFQQLFRQAMNNDMGIGPQSFAPRQTIFQSRRRFDLNIVPLIVEASGNTDVDQPHGPDVQQLEVGIGHPIGSEVTPDLKRQAFELRHVVGLGNVQRFRRIHSDLCGGGN